MLICTCLIGLSDICTYCVVYRSEAARAGECLHTHGSKDPLSPFL